MNISKDIIAEHTTSIIKHFLFSLRGLLWIIADILALYFSAKYHHTPAMMIALFLGLPISLILCFKRMVKDIISIRNKYAYHIFKEVCNDISNDEKIVNSPILGKSTLGKPSEEFFIDLINSHTYSNLTEYLHRFTYRDDAYAQNLKSSLTKSLMIKNLRYYQQYVSSIRIWKDKGLISINYEEPIEFSEIVSFEITYETMIQRGNDYSKTTFTRKDYSYKTIFGNYKYRGNIKSYSTTVHDPDHVVKNFSLFLTTNKPGMPTINAKIGNDAVLAYQIKGYFLQLGIGSERNNPKYGYRNASQSIEESMQKEKLFNDD